VSISHELFSNIDQITEELKEELDKEREDKGIPYRLNDSSKTKRPRYGRFPSEMPSKMQQAVIEVLPKGARPYYHQSRSWKALYDRNSLIITTPTASGKTMAFNPVILDQVIRHNCSALYVYPLIDLATSQQVALEDLINTYTEISGEGCTRVTAVHSNDEKEWLPKMRGEHDFVLTTPESLHKNIIPRNYPNWCRFLKRLRFVVLDETHTYSGIFGSNMAFILRRLVHRIEKVGGQPPQFILCSATIKEPKQFAKKLLPVQSKITHIKTASDVAPPRHEIAFLAKRDKLVDLFIRLLNSEIHDDISGKKRPVRTILFINSRKGVSNFVNSVRSSLKKHRLTRLENNFTGYWAGKANGRETFRNLMNGDISSIVTTCKLMAGIDIGSLDVSIVYRFQRRFMNMRQMFGRAARRSRGAWIFIGSQSSLDDQFIVDSFPNVFECEDPESSVIDLGNRYLLAAHYDCMNGNVPNISHKQEGPAIPSLVKKYLKISNRPELPDRQPMPDPWESDPLKNLQLRGSTVGPTYKLVLDGVEETGEDAHQLPQHLAYRDHHPRAIIEIDDVVYQIDTITEYPEYKISASSISDRKHRTRCTENLEIKCTKSQGGFNNYSLTYEIGRYHISQKYVKYDLLEAREKYVCPHRRCEEESQFEGKCTIHKNRKLRYVKNWKKVGNEDITPLLSIELDTVGVKIGFKKIFSKYIRNLKPKGNKQSRANKSLNLSKVTESIDRNGLLTAMQALILNSYEDAFIAESEILGSFRNNDNQDILFYDNFQDGIGISAMLFEDKKAFIFKKAFDRVNKCKCKSSHGCLKCTMIPSLSDEFKSEKKEARDFLEWFVNEKIKK